MQNSTLPPKFPIPFANNAGSSYIRPIPQASQQGITPGAASLTDGFPPICFIPTTANGIPPAGPDFNGILNQITAWNRWQSAGGTVPFDQTFANAVGGYPYGAVVQSTTTSGRLWISTADNNTTNPDSGGAANWVRVVLPSDVFVALQTGLIPFPRAYNTAATWTKQPNLVYIRTFGVGGGGGGGFGVSNTPTMWFGGAGGGGAYSEDYFAATSLPATVAITIGAGGAAGNSGQTTGISGGTTTFGGLLTAKGGAGGVGVFNGPGTPGAGGAGSTDQITIGGPNGTPGYQSPAIALPTQLGLNGQGGISGAGTSNGSFTPVAASAGQNGVLLVLEFYLPV